MPHDEVKWMKLGSYNQTPSPSIPVNSNFQAKGSKERNNGEDRKNEFMLLQ